jgi:hypothetical protein
VTFVVGSAPDWSNGTNAFIVTVTDPQDISYARVLVATGGLCKAFGHCYDWLPVFTIEVGADGTNRNVALPAQPLWSWHVTRIASWATSSFPDYPYQHPWQLEQAIQAGAITGSITTGFYHGYTFLAEIDAPLRLYEQASYDGTLFDFIGLYWTHDKPGLSYDVEYTYSLEHPDWQAMDLQAVTNSAIIDFGPWGLARLGPSAFAVLPLSDKPAYFRLRAQP